MASEMGQWEREGGRGKERKRERYVQGDKCKLEIDSDGYRTVLKSTKIYQKQTNLIQQNWWHC